MKISTIILTLITTSFMFACNNQSANDNHHDSNDAPKNIDTLAILVGNWKIDSLNSERYELSDCEKDMNFEFSETAGESKNNIPMRLLKVTQGKQNPCDFPGPKDNYETNYGLYSGYLYIQNFKLDKKQFSGTFAISDLSDSRITLTSMKHSFKLKKIK